MSISFSDIELINIAIDIERSGIAFYDVMAKSTQNASVQDVFQYLADMERQHIQIFQGMLDEANKHQVPETYTEEYTVYLQALVDSAVFTSDMAISDMAAQLGNDIGTLELAINAEKDSILFYYEMRDIVPQPVQPTVNKIIAEEKSHLQKLSGIKKKLA